MTTPLLPPSPAARQNSILIVWSFSSSKDAIKIIASNRIGLKVLFRRFFPLSPRISARSNYAMYTENPGGRGQLGQYLCVSNERLGLKTSWHVKEKLFGLVILVLHRVVSEQVLAVTEIPGGGGRGNWFRIQTGSGVSHFKVSAVRGSHTTESIKCDVRIWK